MYTTGSLAWKNWVYLGYSKEMLCILWSRRHPNSPVSPLRNCVRSRCHDRIDNVYVSYLVFVTLISLLSSNTITSPTLQQCKLRSVNNSTGPGLHIHPQVIHVTQRYRLANGTRETILNPCVSITHFIYQRLVTIQTEKDGRVLLSHATRLFHQTRLKEKVSKYTTFSYFTCCPLCLSEQVT